MPTPFIALCSTYERLFGGGDALSCMRKESREWQKCKKRKTQALSFSRLLHPPIGNPERCCCALRQHAGTGGGGAPNERTPQRLPLPAMNTGSQTHLPLQPTAAPRTLCLLLYAGQAEALTSDQCRRLVGATVHSLPWYQCDRLEGGSVTVWAGPAPQ
jgi:hypothetical protein